MIWNLWDMSLCTSSGEGDYYHISPLVFLVLSIDSFYCDISSMYSLPWQGLKAGNKKQKYEKISERKVSTSIEVPCLQTVCSDI